jgi:Fe-S-cluster containining protein
MPSEPAGQRPGVPANQFVVLQQDARLIQIVDAALADATRRAGPHLACRPGCTQCCYGAFAINPLDALRLRTAMAKMAIDQPAQAAAIAERTNRYLAEFGPSFPGNPQTGILGTSDEEQEAFEDFANQAPCPALNPESGLCEMYDTRPMTCRVFGPPVRMNSDSKAEVQASSEPAEDEGLAVCELCFTEASPNEIAEAEMIVPYAEEQRLLDLLQELDQLDELDQLQPIQPVEPDAIGDTIIAYCLTLPPALPEPS